MKRFISLFIFCILFSFTIFGQSIEQVKPWLGISIESKPNGVNIIQAIQGTPAEKAGLKTGDLIKKVDSVPVKEPKELIGYIQSKGVGYEVIVEFERDRKPMKLAIKLEARPDEFAVVKKQLTGKPMPDFSLEGMNEKKTFTKKDIASKVTIIEFWATWCGPCRASHERLSEFAEKNPSVQVLAVSNEETELIQRYMKSTKHKFTTVRDASGDLHKTFMVSAIPMTALIDKQGRVHSLSLGGGSYLEEILQTASELGKK